MDGVRLHPHQALAMTREQALRTLLLVGDEQDKHYAASMIAGPVITDEEMRALAGFRPQMKRSIVFTKFAIAGLLCAS